MILPQEVIRKKRDGGALSAGELQAFFGGFLTGDVADYQMGAMLMAITMKGMDERETAALTRLMLDSGSRFEWGYPKRLVVDKHSTGGIGDKTSIILLPLCLREGLKVPMMAGRGLGHTGGTLDKLEAVGWHVFPSLDAARAQVDRLGGVIMGQTAEVAPLDRRLYAMRDVTATVESIPLIVGSILSKKLAEGLGGLVMDVKFGSGAFMHRPADARALAAALKRVGQECGLEVRCVLSSMNSPLGRTAGNALEIMECVEVLRGGGPDDTRELSLVLAGEMVRLAYPEQEPREIRQRLERHLADGSAFEAFLQVAAAQGGDLGLLEKPESLVRAPVQLPVLPASDTVARAARYVRSVDVRRLGLAILELGGGRRLVTDKIDPWVGLSHLKRVGEPVVPGEPVATVHASDKTHAAAAADLVREAYSLGDVAAGESLISEMM